MGGSSGGSTANNSAPYGRNRDGTASTQAEREAWNRLKGSTGLSGEALYQQQTRSDPMADFYAMLESGGGEHEAATSHQASGPSDEEIAQNEQNQGLTDLQTGYDAYLTASEDATSYVNNVIDSQRSEAALMGSDFSITDEQKSTRINDRFAEIFDADKWNSLQKLNEDWGQYRDDQLEFLVTRGAVGDDNTEVDGKAQTASTFKGSAPTGPTDSLLATDPGLVQNSPTATLLGG